MQGNRESGKDSLETGLVFWNVKSDRSVEQHITEVDPGGADAPFAGTTSPKQKQLLPEFLVEQLRVAFFNGGAEVARFTFGIAVLVFANPSAAGSICCFCENSVRLDTLGQRRFGMLSRPADSNSCVSIPARSSQTDAFERSAGNLDSNADAYSQAVNQNYRMQGSGLFSDMLRLGARDMESPISLPSTAGDNRFGSEIDLGSPSLEPLMTNDVGSAKSEAVGPATTLPVAAGDLLMTVILFGVILIAVWADACA